VQIGPEDTPAHPLGNMEHVVMVVSVDAEVDEAEHVAQEHRPQRPQGGEIGAVRHLHLQHHDGDDDKIWHHLPEGPDSPDPTTQRLSWGAQLL
jgi:hypothetical protein